MSSHTFTGWDAIERWQDAARPDDADGESGHLDEDTVSRLLLVELDRPPWWRELDRERRALAQELT